MSLRVTPFLMKHHDACRLCRNERPLMKSHIIPEFFWTPLYDAKHQVSSKAASRRYRGRVRKGVRERLLCSACEGHLGVYEHYVADLWYGNNKFPTQLRLDDAAVRLVEYAPFKLLHLSILWRAHESSLPEFSAVALGTYAAQLREHLLNGSAPSSSTFPLAAQVIVNPLDSSVMHDMIAPPTFHRIDGRRVYVMIYGGCLWWVGVSAGALAHDPDVLQEDGRFSAAAVSLENLPSIGKLMLQ